MIKQILIVDDDTSLASALRDEVVRMGYAAQICGSVNEAIEKLVNSQFDVLLTDLRMAGRDGIELIKAVSKISPQTRSLLMSAFATAKDYKVATEHGAIDVLTKPFTPADLAEALRKAEDCQDGVQGTLHGVEIADILQLFHFGRRSLIVHVGSEGEIHVKEGEIVHAKTATAQGEEALEQLLGGSASSVRTAPSGVGVPRTIDASFESLLLDVHRRIDESNRDDSLIANVDLADSFADETPATIVNPPSEALRPDDDDSEKAAPFPLDNDDPEPSQGSEQRTAQGSSKRWIVMGAALAAVAFLGWYCVAREGDEKKKKTLTKTPSIAADLGVAKKADAKASSASMATKSVAPDATIADSKTTASATVDAAPVVDSASGQTASKGVDKPPVKAVAAKKPKRPAYRWRRPKPKAPKPPKPKPPTPAVATKKPREPKKPALGAADSTKPKLAPVDTTKPKLGIVGEGKAKPRLGTVGDDKKAKLKPID
jgi:CheY-like chemotaxis protein